MRVCIKANRGFTLIEIMIVVAILALIMAIAFPNFMRVRKEAQRNICIENLTQIESAKQIFGIESGKKTGDPILESELIGPLLYIKKMPECPAGGVYDFESIGTNATCNPFGTSDGHRVE